MLKQKILALIMSVMMLFTVGASAAGEGQNGQDTLQELQSSNGENLKVYSENGTTFVDGACTSRAIRDQSDAQKVLEDMIPALGGNERTHFAARRVLKDPAGNVYYVFQQVADDLLVLGGAAKVITDSDGNMKGMTASIISDLPDADARSREEELTEQKVEELVLRHEAERGNGNETVIEGATSRIVLPVNRELDIEADTIESRYVWVVYTNNTSASVAGLDLPYLAHYVTLGGEYLYSLPTIIPGDAAGSAGYDASYLFEFMEPAEYTGYVDMADGTEKELTVTLMRDTRTGMYYLGNIEHRIVVADCWEFLYNKGRVVVEYSPDNREWDQVGLLSLYNYCKAWNYYNAIGWKGGDGEGTPIIVLKDFCDQDHVPVDNAAYAGKFYGYQTFLSSAINSFSQCLDVCAHEFTHCVTDTVMTYNAYMNDFGAINEALSDIHGNLCEEMLDTDSSQEWLIGEDSSTSIRSMSDPNRYDQPMHVWDIHYYAQVKEPTAANDYGGVHSNSSLLSRVAWMLCKEGGMSLEDARAFWFAVDCSLVPGSDYPQLQRLLPWVLKNMKLDAYEDTLARAIEETRLGETAMPETIDADRAMLTLELPDNEVFNNGKWAMSVFSLNIDMLTEKLEKLGNDIANGSVSDYPNLIRKMVELDKETKGTETEEKKKPSFWESFWQALTAPEDPQQEEITIGTQEDYDELSLWLGQQAQDIFYNGMGSAGADGHIIHMMSRPGRTVPVLMYLSVKPGGAELEQLKIVCLLNGRWYDLSNLKLFSNENAEEIDWKEIVIQTLESKLFEELVRAVISPDWKENLLNMLTLNVVGGEKFILPTEGLEEVDLSRGLPVEEAEQQEPVVNKKSRPKES